MPNPVSAADLATARTAAESLMIDAVTIKRPTTAKSTSGGNLPAFSAGVVTVCRKRDLEGNEQLKDGQLEPVKVSEFFLPHGTDVRTEDQLLHAGLKFEVIDVEKRTTLVQQRCLAKKAAA